MSKLDDLSAWRLFCSLCNTRNFSDTAGEFDVEVSTVSRALTSLENALGQTLILRVTRPLQLTESGQIAYEHASNILLQHEEMVKELTQSSAGMAGKIRLSLAPGSVAVYIPMLMEFNSQYPEIVFDIVGGGNVQDILQYKADISVASFKSKDPRIVSYSRGRNVYVPVASRRYIEEHGMPLHPKDLAAHTVLVYDGSVRSATRYLENGDKREEVKWKQVLRVSNILAIKKSVIDGLGISVDLPLFIVHRKSLPALWCRFSPVGSTRRWSALCAPQKPTGAFGATAYSCSGSNRAWFNFSKAKKTWWRLSGTSRNAPSSTKFRVLLQR